MDHKINLYPSKQKPDPVRDVYEPLTYYAPASYSMPSRYQNIRTVRTKHKIHPNKFSPQAFESDRARQYHRTMVVKAIPETSGDSYFIVNKVMENRLDVIAQKYYGTPTYWWVIAQANPDILFDPFNVPLGTSLRIPSVQTLYQTGGVLSGR